MFTKVNKKKLKSIDCDGWTLLHRASYGNDDRNGVAEYLLKFMSKEMVNMPIRRGEHSGYTALMLAFKYDNTRIAASILASRLVDFKSIYKQCKPETILNISHIMCSAVSTMPPLIASTPHPPPPPTPTFLTTRTMRRCKYHVKKYLSLGPYHILFKGIYTALTARSTPLAIDVVVCAHGGKQVVKPRPIITLEDESRGNIHVHVLNQRCTQNMPATITNIGQWNLLYIDILKWWTACPDINPFFLVKDNVVGDEFRGYRLSVKCTCKCDGLITHFVPLVDLFESFNPPKDSKMWTHAAQHRNISISSTAVTNAIRRACAIACFEIELIKPIIQNWKYIFSIETVKSDLRMAMEFDVDANICQLLHMWYDRIFSMTDVWLDIDFILH